LTEYIISPTVKIDGDGAGALAYSTINSTSNSINSIEIINPGSGYTYANVTIVANTLYGSGANLFPIISPINGHGYDPINELGSTYAGISVTFDTAINESFKFPLYGQYRKVGIIEQPLYSDVTINCDSFERAKLLISNKYNNFSEGEVVIQSSSNAYGVVVYSNSSFVELKNIGGSWISNNTNDNILGLLSGATANVSQYGVTYFTLGANVEIVSEVTSGGYGEIKQIVSNNQIKLTNVTGRFSANDTIIDYNTNTYANVVSIHVANNTIDQTSIFGKRINQTARVTLSSHYGIFTEYEYVYQDVTKAYGKIISTIDDLDLVYSISSGTFSNGDVVTTSNGGGSGYAIFANSTYLKLTAMNGTMHPSDTISNGIGASGTVSNVYQVLLLSDINGPNKFQTGLNTIRGNNSLAYGISVYDNSIMYPDIVRESGKVLYMENLSPFERSNTSKEEVSLVIKF
jgi:hypothetical protein